MFDGKLGRWKGKPYDIELKPDVTPYHSRPFSLPKCYEKTLRKEVERLCKIGVLKRVNRSEPRKRLICGNHIFVHVTLLFFGILLIILTTYYCVNGPF